MASSVVTASQFDEERTLTGTPSGSATNEEGASGSLGVSWSEEASVRFPHPPLLQRRPRLMRLTVQTLHPAHQLRSQPQPLTSQTGGVSSAKFQVYSDAKFLTDKGVMTRTLPLERRVLTGSLPTMPEIHNLFTKHRLEWTARPLGRQRGNGPRVLRILRSNSLITDR